ADFPVGGPSLTAGASILVERPAGLETCDTADSKVCATRALARGGHAFTLRPMSWNVLLTARTLNEVSQSTLDLLRQAGCHLITPPRYKPLAAEELLSQLKGVDAVLASMDKFTPAVLESSEASQLKIISRWGVGYDAIDVPSATRRGI